MNCPACNKEMQEQDLGGVVVDVCAQGCHGIWFDWLELVKIDEPGEGSGDALAQAMMHPHLNDANRGPINCPKCNMPMRVHTYKRAQTVHVDECYQCGGFFLDSGELRLVRESYMTDREYAEFVDQLVGDIEGMPEYEADLERRFVRGKAMLRLTRFVRPSYLVPRLLKIQPAEEVNSMLPQLLTKYQRDKASVHTPEMKELLEKYSKQEAKKRTPEQKAYIDEYKPIFT